MGHTKAKGHDAIVQTTDRTKILIDNLAPSMLRRLVALEYCKDKANEKSLNNLILERAREQQHYFLMTKDDKVKQTTQRKPPLVASLIFSMLWVP